MQVFIVGQHSCLPLWLSNQGFFHIVMLPVSDMASKVTREGGEIIEKAFQTHTKLCTLVPIKILHTFYWSEYPHAPLNTSSPLPLSRNVRELGNTVSGWTATSRQSLCTREKELKLWQSANLFHQFKTYYPGFHSGDGVTIGWSSDNINHWFLAILESWI